MGLGFTYNSRVIIFLFSLEILFYSVKYFSVSKLIRLELFLHMRNWDPEVACVASSCDTFLNTFTSTGTVTKSQSHPSDACLV